MGRRMTHAKALLEAMAAVDGDVAVMADFSTQLIQGMSPKQIADEMGIPVSSLYQFFNSTPTRREAYKEALRVKADVLAHDSLQDVADADPESVQVSALRAGHKLKLAGKWDREGYGDRPTEGGGFSISVFVDRGAALTDDTPLTIDQAPEAPLLAATPGPGHCNPLVGRKE